MANIQILDCTLRDGGLGLEDAEKNKIASVYFNGEDIKETADCLTKAKIDIIELGSLEITQDDRKKFAIYPSVESISVTIPNMKNPNQMYAALFRGPDTPIEDIPNWNPSLCEVVRVIIRYSELQKSLDFCAALSEKGYKVFVQPMLTMRYTDDEIALLIEESNRMKAYALYFVDSYGYMQDNDVRRLFDMYNNKLNPEIKIGFHAHNNMNLAFSNVLSFIEMADKAGRDIVIDSCLLGMGQGAGNLQTELMIGYLSQIKEAKYDYDEVLNGCEVVEKYTEQTLWGYSVTRLLPAIHKAAYKYAIVLRSQYGLKYSDMNTIFANMSTELKQRYTPENVVKVLEEAGFVYKIRNEE